MEKRKCLTFLFCLLLCYSLFQHTAIAQSPSQAIIFSQGSISYPSSNVNLAVIPDDWGVYDNAPSSYTAICHLDYSVEHTAGSPSIRIDPHTSSDTDICRECDGTWYSCNPGDNIVASVWIMVDTTTAYTNKYNGGRLGMDFYAPNGNGGITIVYSLPTDANNGISTVTFGTVGWKQVSWDVTVPSTTYTQDVNGNTIPATPITQFVCWLDVNPTSGSASVQGTAWFADAVLYINPA
jgi:hypothetical protein